MKNKNPLTRQGIGLIVMLIIQYFLGMYVNLYTSFPDDKDKLKLWEFAGTQIPLVLHMAMGTLLVIAGLVLVISSYKCKSDSWKFASLFGFVGIVLAAFTGERFVSTQQEIYSYGMSSFYILSVLAYCLGIYNSKE